MTPDDVKKMYLNEKRRIRTKANKGAREGREISDRFRTRGRVAHMKKDVFFYYPDEENDGGFLPGTATRP